MRKFYLMPLNPKSSGCLLKFSVYELKDYGSLSLVWPYPSDEDRASIEELDRLSAAWRNGHDRIYRNAAKRLGMVYNRDKQGPRFVFAYGGGGYCKATALAEHLAKVFPEPIEVYDLGTGHAASLVGRFNQ